MLTEERILNRLTSSATAEKHIYYGIPWKTYLQLLDELGDNSSVRLTYSQGVLEGRVTKRRHEQLTRLVDMVVTLLAFELGMNVDNCGAMTMRVDSIESGGEPDSCFYITHESEVRGVEDIDLQIHPPPDIVLEVDITSPSLDKFELYAAAGVPEVWRHDGDEIKFYALIEGQYQITTNSRCFPHLSSEMLEHYIDTGRDEGSTAMLQMVRNEIPA